MTEHKAEFGFVARFGHPPQVQTDAPGRVNLIGEHTDYHQGFVLPMVLPQRTVVQLRATTEDRVRVVSGTMGAELREYTLGAEAAQGEWLDYVQALTWALRRRGHRIAGADLLIESTVPAGAGVSSSAALQVSLLRALRAAFDLHLDDVEIARVAHEAEVGFVGAAVGIMDHMVCSVGRDHTALFLDTQSLQFEHLPLPTRADLAVIDSGITHRHVGGEYATRRRESFAAASALGAHHLRELAGISADRLDTLPPLLQRRARHVLTENARVLAAVEALRAGEIEALGPLLNASHQSLRDDYETSLPDIDLLVALAQSDPAVYGARLTGGGFGGAIVVLTQSGQAAGVAARVLEAYERRVERRGRILLPVTARKAHVS